MSWISFLYNDDSTFYEMKIAKIKYGIHTVQVWFNKNKSDDYIRTIIKEKAPNWELVKIVIQDDGK